MLPLQLLPLLQLQQSVLMFLQHLLASFGHGGLTPHCRILLTATAAAAFAAS
jgi:hypothetical protein